jgi:hypothetical protein
MIDERTTVKAVSGSQTVAGIGSSVQNQRWLHISPDSPNRRIAVPWHHGTGPFISLMNWPS